MGEYRQIGRPGAFGGCQMIVFGALASAALLAAAPSHAVVATDGSLGAAGPVLPGYDVNGNDADYLIAPELGEMSGTNLFHSFSIFDIEFGKVATFEGPDQATVTRIISRVTGGTQSSIAGTLRSTVDNADVYLLNPAGIAFHNGANLDVPGSIYLSTADVLRFDGDEPFVVASPNTFLSAAAPTMFGFVSADPEPIVIGRSQGVEYHVPPGKTLSFVGGDVVITGPPNSDVIVSPGSEVQIASAASGIDIPVDIRDMAPPSTFEAGELGKVAVSGANISVDGAASGAAGSIVIRGESFQLNNRSTLSSNHRSPSADSDGAIDIAVRDKIDLVNGNLFALGYSTTKGSGISLSGDEVRIDGTFIGVGSLGSGDGGDLEILARWVALESNSQVGSFSFGSGNGSGLSVSGQDGGPAETIEISNARLTTEASGDGAGGAITLDTDALFVTDGGSIESVTSGKGEDAGAGGTIALGSAERPIADVQVVDGGRILSVTEGSANGGDIVAYADSLWAHNEVAGNDTFVFTTTRGGDGGAGGLIEIHAANVTIEDGAQIFTLTEGSGQGGSLSLIDVDTLRIEGEDLGAASTKPSSLAARVTGSVSGTGGGLSINARIIEVLNGGEIVSRTFGTGDAAPEGVNAIDITASERITIRGGENGASEVSSATEAAIGETGGGNGGDLVIRTGFLELLDGGQVTASTSTVGAAGNVFITADDVVISGADPASHNESGIFARSNSGIFEGTETATGGDIEITAETLRLADDALISVSTASRADAGTIDLQIADTLVVEGGASITAIAEEFGAGRTGSIDIHDARSILVAGEVSTRAFDQQAGSIEIRATESLVVDGGLITSESISGQGGDVSLSGGALVMVSNAGEISARLTGVSGSGSGIIRIDGTDAVELTSGAALTAETAGGTGGSIEITANDSVKLSDASVTAKSTGTGNAGDITIVAGGIFESANSTLTTSAENAAGGEIRIAANNLVYLLDSSFETDVLGGVGGGGNVLIDPVFTVLNRSQITARAVEGNGGNITINTDFYFESGGSGLDASSDFGNDGEILTTVPDTDLSGTLAALPGSFLDASALLARGCAAQTARAGSFVVESTGAIEPPPDAILRATDVGLSGAVEACSP